MTELTHELISAFPQGTAAFVYSWYRLKKRKPAFSKQVVTLVRITPFKVPDFRHSKWMHFWIISPFFQDWDAQTMPTRLALKGTFCWVQRSSDQVIKEVKHFTSKVTAGEYLRLHVKQKVYWAWMLQMKESFHFGVVWEQIKWVGSFSEHNHLFSLGDIKSGHIQYLKFAATLCKSLFWRVFWDIIIPCFSNVFHSNF